MNSQEILELAKHPEEDNASLKIRKWFIAEDVLMQQFEEIEEEGALPDLLGKNILISENQFGNIYKIIESIALLLEIPIPQTFIYDSYDCLVDSEGIRIPRIEISARVIKEFTEKELTHTLAKEMYHIRAGHLLYEVMSEKIMGLFNVIPNLPGINIVKQFGGDLAAQGASFHFRSLAFKWFSYACFSAENFAIAYTNDIKSSISGTLMGIFNERLLIDSININDYRQQIPKIETCQGPAATLEIINEVIPYGPYRIDNMLKYILSKKGRKLYNLIKRRKNGC